MMISPDITAAAAGSAAPMTAAAVAGATPIFGPAIQVAVAASSPTAAEPPPQPAPGPPPRIVELRPADGPPPGLADQPPDLARYLPGPEPAPDRPDRPPDVAGNVPGVDDPPDVAWFVPADDQPRPTEPTPWLVSSDARSGEATAGAEPGFLDGIAGTVLGISPSPGAPAAGEPAAEPSVFDVAATIASGVAPTSDATAAGQSGFLDAAAAAAAGVAFGVTPTSNEPADEQLPGFFAAAGGSQDSQTGLLAVMGEAAEAGWPQPAQQAGKAPPEPLGLVEIVANVVDSLAGTPATDLPPADHPLVRALQNGDRAAYASLPDSAIARLGIQRGEAPRTSLPDAQALVYELENPGAIAPNVLFDGEGAAGGIPKDAEPTLAAARAASDEDKRKNAERLRDRDATISRTNANVAAEWLRAGLLRGDPAAIDALSLEARCTAEITMCPIKPAGPLTPEQVERAMRGLERVENGSGLTAEDEARAVRDSGVTAERPTNVYEARAFRQAKQRHDVTKPDRQPGYIGAPTPDLTLRQFRAMVDPTEPGKPITGETPDHAVQRAIWGDGGRDPSPAMSPYPEIAAESIEPRPRAVPVRQGETIRTKAHELAGPVSTSRQVGEAAARLVAVNEVRFGKDGKGVDVDAPLDSTYPILIPADEAEHAAHRQALLDQAGRDAADLLRERDKVAKQPMPADPPRDSEQLYYKRVAPGSEQAVPATLDQYRWVVDHLGQDEADEMFIPVELKRVLPDVRGTSDRNGALDDLFAPRELQSRDATVEEYLEVERSRGPDAATQEFYRGPAPSPPAPDDAVHGFLDGTRRALANAARWWEMSTSPARTPDAPDAIKNIQAGIGRLPEDLVKGVDAAFVQIRTIANDVKVLPGIPPGALVHLDGTPVDDAPKRPGETDARAYARTNPVLGGFRQALEHQGELFGAALGGDVRPLVEAWTQRPWDTALELAGLLGPLKGATGALGKTAPGHTKGAREGVSSSIATPLPRTWIEGGGNIPSAMWPTLTPRKPAAAASVAAAAPQRTAARAPQDVAAEIRAPQRPPGRTADAGARGFQARYTSVADDGTPIRKIDDESLPQLRGVYERSGSGGRDVARVPGEYVATEVTGAAGELRTLHWLGGRGDVIKIELVREVNDARRPDILATVRMPDDSIRTTRVEARSLTGAPPGYQPRGIDRKRDSVAREISRAINDKVKSTEDRFSQLNQPIDGVPVGGTLALHVRGGPKTTANVERVMARLQHKLPDYVEEVAIFVGQKTTPMRFVNPHFVQR